MSVSGQKGKLLALGAYVPVVTALVAGTMGALLFAAIGAPAAHLTGSAVGVAVMVALRRPVAVPKALREPSLALIGMMMGAAVTPEALAVFAEIPVALLGLIIAVSAAGAASYLALRRVGGWDPVTAACSSMPGALQVSLAVAEESGARMDRVVLAQAIRLFILVSMVPLVFGGGAEQLTSFSGSDPTALDIVLTLAIAAVVLVLARKTRLPSATLVAPMCVAAALSATGALTVAVPPLLAIATFILLGASVAVRLEGMSGRDVLPAIKMSLLAFLAAFCVSVSVAAVFAALLGASVGTVFLAYAPGGVDAMVALAFLLGFDVAFVAILHVARLIFLSLCGPFLVTWIRRRAARSPSSDTL
ncbi:MAG: AbrB family transcriptional regulator [Pseudomonadota bacterium]